MLFVEGSSAGPVACPQEGPLCTTRAWPLAHSGPTRKQLTTLMSHGVARCLGLSTSEARLSATICCPAICGGEWVGMAAWPGLPDGERDLDVLQTRAAAIGNVISLLRSLVRGGG